MPRLKAIKRIGLPECVKSACRRRRNQRFENSRGLLPLARGRRVLFWAYCRLLTPNNAWTYGGGMNRPPPKTGRHSPTIEANQRSKGDVCSGHEIMRHPIVFERTCVEGKLIFLAVKAAQDVGVVVLCLGEGSMQAQVFYRISPWVNESSNLREREQPASVSWLCWLKVSRELSINCRSRGCDSRGLQPRQ